jgi:hypothetical protein
MRAQYDLFPYIPEDFPLLQISQEALDRLLAKLADWTPLPETTSALLEDLYPLSGMQAGLLFHSQASGLYVEQQSFCIEGALQVPVLIESWEQMLAAHPILRTSFVGEDVLAQAVWRTVPLPLTIIDATQLSPQEQEDLVHAYYQADRRRGFVREQAPLLRLSVVHLGAEQHQLLWSFHHAILDGWSVALLLQEFFARYQALTQGREVQLAASRPYRDYIAWLQQQDQQEAEAFWRQQLGGLTAPPPPPPPTRPPPPPPPPNQVQILINPTDKQSSNYHIPKGRRN